MQFGVAGNARVFLRSGPTDLRFGFEGLRALVVNVIGQEPKVSTIVYCTAYRLTRLVSFRSALLAVS